MNDKITIDTIIEWFKVQAESKIPVDPGKYLDAAQKLNALIGNLDDEVVLYKMKAERGEKKRSQVIEFIRLAKQRAKDGQSEFKSQI